MPRERRACAAPAQGGAAQRPLPVIPRWRRGAIAAQRAPGREVRTAGSLHLVTGPVRSGKSAFARRLAEEGPPPVTFLATLAPSDPEMAARVARHRAERPAHWRTVEPPADVPAALAALAARPGTLLLDSLGGLVAARVTAALAERLPAPTAPRWEPALPATGDGATPPSAAPPETGGTAPPRDAAVLDPAAAERIEASLLADLDAALAAVRAGPATLIVVAEQVGWDVVPSSPVARLFRDLAGLASQRVAAAADTAWLLVAGRALPLPSNRTDGAMFRCP